MNILEHPDYKKYIEFLQHKKYSELTITSYSSVLYNFLEWLDVPPSRSSNKHFREFILLRRFNSSSDQNRYISALKLYYFKVLGRKQRFPEFERPRKSKPLPVVIDKRIITETLDGIVNLKHKAMLGLAFSAGLRRSEILNLKIKDIDSDRMLIMVRNGKGRKDRAVLLTNRMLKILRDYFRIHRPLIYMFNGIKSIRYSPSSLNNVSKKYFNHSIHKLRHSFATAMIENNNNLEFVKDQMGHNNTKTTEIYTHLTIDSLKNIKTHY